MTERDNTVVEMSFSGDDEPSALEAGSACLSQGRRVLGGSDEADVDSARARAEAGLEMLLGEYQIVLRTSSPSASTLPPMPEGEVVRKRA